MLGSTQERNLSRVYLLLVLGSILFAGGFFTYLAGYGSIRYFNVVTESWKSWTWWEYFITAGIGLVPFIGLWWYVYNISTTQGNTHSGLLFMVCLCVGAWYLVFIIFEAIKWSRCNEFNGLDPREPNCINRDYPAKTLPDTSFFLTFIGACVQLAFCGMAMWLSEQVRCIGTAKNNISIFGGNPLTSNTVYDDTDLESNQRFGIAAKMNNTNSTTFTGLANNIGAKFSPTQPNKKNGSFF